MKRYGSLTVCALLACGVLALSTAMAAGPAPLGASLSSPVLPELAWDEEDQVVFAHVPQEVAAWLGGEIDDPAGDLERWFARFEQQSGTPEFARALVEIQELARAAAAAGDLSAFEVNSTVIPRVLEERIDLRRMLGGEATPASSPAGKPGDVFGEAECYKVEWGRWYCKRQTFFGFCLDDDCNLNSAAKTCSETTPIPCPAGFSIGR